MKSNTIVTCQWLKEHINDKNLVILDASFTRSNESLNLENIQIPNAIFFDLKKVFSEQSSALPNTVPDISDFESACRELGINNDHHIIIYDNKGIYTSPRAWWLFKLMGHDKVSVLNGGLPEWLSSGYDVEPISETPNLDEGNFKANYIESYIKKIKDIDKNIKDGSSLIIDARNEERFQSLVPEPRPNLRSGNIPHSANLFYAKLLEDGKYKSLAELKKIISPFQDQNDHIIFSCGSGITACILLLGFEMISSDNDYSVYDGSWSEWGTLRS